MLTRSLLFIGLAFSSAHAGSATILLTGANFDVRYDSSALGNYGSPTLSGNVVYFTPTTFKTESLNGNGFSTTSGTVNFQIIPKNSFAIADLTLLERGDYVLRGTSSFVGVSGQTRAFGVLNPMMETSAAITSSSNLTIATGSQQNWTANSSLNLASLNLTPNQIVNYTVENLLEAYTESSATGPRRAFIEKKFSAFSVNVVSPVPEPSSILMMLCGIGFVGFIARKKKISSQNS
jgi:PEP-CTERM motif